MSLVRELDLRNIPSTSEYRYSGRFTREFLAERQHVGDPLADAVVAELVRRDALPRDWSQLTDTTMALTESEGGVFREFMNAANFIPSWVDFRKMEPAQRMVFTHLPLLIPAIGTTLLGTAFLPGLFPVAVKSNAIAYDAPSRFAESGMFIVKPAIPGGLQPGGTGHYEILRARLLHGALRYRVSLERGDLAQDYGRDGMPINQIELAYFLSVFSYLLIRSFVRMGIRVSDEEVESHHLYWRYVGYVLGIDESLLTETMAEEKALCLALIHHMAEPGLSSPAVMNLIRTVLDGNFGGGKRAGEARMNTAIQLVLHNMGEELLTGWGVKYNPDHKGLRRVLLMTKLGGRILGLAPVRSVSYRFLASRVARGDNIFNFRREAEIQNLQADPKGRQSNLHEFFRTEHVRMSKARAARSAAVRTPEGRTASEPAART